MLRNICVEVVARGMQMREEVGTCDAARLSSAASPMLALSSSALAAFVAASTALSSADAALLPPSTRSFTRWRILTCDVQVAVSDTVMES